MRRLEARWSVTGKYGFIYKWHDQGRDRYYIGSHWGKFGDRYICSSDAMRKAHLRRPKDFRRRILAVVTTNRVDLLSLEQRYIDKIPRKQFGVRAYNVSVKVHKPWWAKGSKVKKAICEKMSKAVRRKNTPAQLASYKRRRGRPISAEHRAKISVAQLGVPKDRQPYTAAEKRTIVAKISKSLKGIPKSEQHRASLSRAGMGHKISTATRRKIADTLSGRSLSTSHRAAISKGLFRANGSLGLPSA